MNIELLRTFLEVERLRHFGNAAEGLHVTQAAVSARIKTLEEQLGAVLFDRGGKEVQLTPAGHKLRRHADYLVSGWQRARQEVASEDSKDQVALGGSLRLWNVLLQPWLHRVHQQIPDCALTAESHTPEILTRRLLEGALDIAIMLEPAQLETLEIREIGLLHLDLISSERHADVQQALAGQYVYVDWGIAHGVEHARRFPDVAPPVMRVSQARMALDYILEFGGSAWLPRNIVEGDLAAGRLFRVPGAAGFSRSVYGVFRLRNAKTDLIERCLKAF